MLSADGFFFFFFSSRRRHTRWPRDWSSDVCSSDLGQLAGVPPGRVGGDGSVGELGAAGSACSVGGEIGRASCRERVWVSVVGGAVIRKRGGIVGRTGRRQRAGYERESVRRGTAEHV